jgi:hypothetical protein
VYSSTRRALLRVMPHLSRLDFRAQLRFGRRPPGSGLCRRSPSAGTTKDPTICASSASASHSTIGQPAARTAEPADDNFVNRKKMELTENDSHATQSR